MVLSVSSWTHSVRTLKLQKGLIYFFQLLFTRELVQGTSYNIDTYLFLLSGESNFKKSKWSSHCVRMRKLIAQHWTSETGRGLLLNADSSVFLFSRRTPLHLLCQNSCFQATQVHAACEEKSHCYYVHVCDCSLLRQEFQKTDNLVFTQITKISK